MPVLSTCKVDDQEGNTAAVQAETAARVADIAFHTEEVPVVSLSIEYSRGFRAKTFVFEAELVVTELTAVSTITLIPTACKYFFLEFVCLLLTLW